MPADVTLALALLNTLLNYIAQLRSAGGLADDALAAQVQSVTTGNDQAYQALITALNLPPKT
jgi:hypothetical protein